MKWIILIMVLSLSTIYANSWLKPHSPVYTPTQVLPLPSPEAIPLPTPKIINKQVKDPLSTIATVGKYRNKRLIGAINYHTPVFSTLGDVHRHTSGDGNVALYWFQNKYLGETAQYHFGSSWRSVPNTYHNHKAIVKSTVLYRLKKRAGWNKDTLPSAQDLKLPAINSHNRSGLSYRQVSLLRKTIGQYWASMGYEYKGQGHGWNRTLATYEIHTQLLKNRLPNDCIFLLTVISMEQTKFNLKQHLSRYYNIDLNVV